jgi:four helix bundle protein
MAERFYNIAERLIKYASSMMDLAERLPSIKVGNHLAGQLIRSCTSPAFNYAEAEAAESRNDFVHKLQIALKELKECRIAVKLIILKNLVDSSISQANLNETEELIAIIGKSVSTARKQIGT